MQLLHYNMILPGQAIKALCWMLVHSLWIGLVLTIVTGIIMQCTKKRSAALRYNLLTATLLLFTIAIISVFILQVSDTGSTITNPLAAPAASTTVTTGNSSTAFIIIDEGEQSFTASIVAFFNNNAIIIVTLWFLAIVFRCVMLVGGLRKIKQLRTVQLVPVGEQWNEKLECLCTRLKISSPVQFFQSGLAKVPMVVGHFKPIILFPLGVLTSLPAAEVEAILLHELAHIRRKDYLVNMLQNFIEILFFFNPAILWVSSLIKIERENCCDDIAVAQSSSKRNYINALVSFQEYHLNAPQYAPALASSKEHLLLRVKRMLYNNNKTLNTMEKTFLTIGFVVMTSLMVVFAQTKTVHSTSSSISTTTSDTAFSFTDKKFDPNDFEEGSAVTVTFSQKINGIPKNIKLYKKNGILYEVYDDITRFKINGKTIPQENWGQYKQLLDEIKINCAKVSTAPDKIKVQAEINELASRTQQLQLEQEKLSAGKNEKEAAIEKLNAENNAQLQQLNTLQKSLPTLDMEKDGPTQHLKAQQESLQKSKEKTTTKTTTKKEQVWTREDENGTISSSLSYSTNSKVEVPVTVTKPINQAVLSNPIDQAYTVTGIQSEGNTVDDKMDVEKTNKNFIADLVKEKIINTSVGLSYQMTSQSLIVNGKTQPASIHEKLKEKYIQSPDWKLLYNWTIK